MNKFFNVGDIIYGFCDGFFGSYDTDAKICVFVAEKYAVFQWIEGDFEGKATVLNETKYLLTKKDVDRWKIKS